VEWALTNWPKPLTDNLARFIGAFAEIGNQMAEAAAKLSGESEESIYTSYVPPEDGGTNYAGPDEPESDDPAVREANRLELERLTREFRENRDPELVAA
jgi:hypothetical protein